MNQTIEWVKSQELPSGGLAAWPGMSAYPECSGYMIPTLLNYGENELAGRLANWLESIQNPDGSFNGLDGVPHAFDTAAVIEGLRATKRRTAEKRAMEWMETQMLDDMLRDHPNSDAKPTYNIRALAIMGKKKFSEFEDINGMRAHYFMYALEGMLNMGRTETVKDFLDFAKISPSEGLLTKHMGGNGSDTCATAQAACLRLRLGLPADDYIEAVRAKVYPDGSLPHDNTDTKRNIWACKYWLDALYLKEGNNAR